jgi:hypothetical protein
MLRGTIRDQVTLARRPPCGSSPASRICRTNRRTPAPDAVAMGDEPLLVVSAGRRLA